MGFVTTTLPTIGDPNSTEDVDVRAALAAIIAVLNGNVDTANIAASGVASSDIAAGAVSKAKLAADALSAFLQLGTTVLGLRAEFGVDSVAYGGGGTSVARSVGWTAMSGSPKFAAAIPIGVNTSGAHPLISVITAATSTGMSFSIVDVVPATVVGAGTYQTYYLAIG